MDKNHFHLQNGSTASFRKAENDEKRGMLSTESRTYNGKHGSISANASPIAVEAGMQVLNPVLEQYLAWRGHLLSRSPEGRAFLEQGGGAKAGEPFVQPELAKTLRAVAEQGADYMYKGEWAEEFVRMVQREGGKAALADLFNYEVHWCEPFSTPYAGSEVYAPGGTNFAGYNIIPSLNVVEAMGLDQRDPYWVDPESFVKLSAVTQLMEDAPVFSDSTRALFADRGIDYSPEAQLTKTFAEQVAPLVEQTVSEASGDNHHSNAIVVMDEQGNVASITHTINAVIWGSSGIVVGGVPIPDSAGFQQARLAKIKPGDRVPNEMIQTIVMKDGKPILATAGIGASLVPESLKVVQGVAGKGKGLLEVQSAPPLLANSAAGAYLEKTSQRCVAVPEGAYHKTFLEHVREQGLNVIEVPAAQALGVRGTIAAAALQPETDVRTAVSVAGTLLFGDAY